MIVEFQAMKVLQMRACLYNIVTEVVHKIAKADYQGGEWHKRFGQ